MKATDWIPNVFDKENPDLLVKAGASCTFLCIGTIIEIISSCGINKHNISECAKFSQLKHS